MTSTALLASLVSLSNEQLSVVQHVDTGAGNFIVRARAGTGKTFLILQSLPLMRGTICILAYGRAIAAEIRSKVAAAGHRNVDVSTFHAIGDKIIRKILPNAKIEGRGKGAAGYYKFDRIAEELQIPKYLLAFVKKTMSMAMLHGVGLPGLMSAKDVDAWNHLVEHYNIGSEIADDNVVIQLRSREALILEGLRFAHQALNASRKMAHEVYSFDEMLWLPLILNAEFPKFDWLCIDEAQDSNPVRIEIARRMCNERTRMMWVGDDKQAIFGFTGSMSDSLDIIQRQFACKVFPMTMTFRCGKAIVELAKEIVPDYKAAPGNHEGSVSYISEDDFAKREMVPGDDAVICRNTRPLVKVAYDLIKRGVPAHIEGREIGKGLLALVNRWQSIKTVPALVSKLSDWRDREVAKLNLDKREIQAEALDDKVETVLAIIEGLPKGSKIDDLRAKIDSMFADTEAGEKAPTVTLMTAHRSKGREFHTVYLYGAAQLMPSKRAKQEHEIQQEMNLLYVARTRAIHNHVEVAINNPSLKGEAW
jgi:DNA helicase-2/ATP-dependent DNA helicase PcrA